MLTAYLADSVFTPRGIERDVAVLVADGVITGVGQPIPPGTRMVRLPGHSLWPGLIDIHIHGRAGADVMDATPQALQTIADALPQTGVVAWVGTTVSAPQQDVCRALRQVGAFIAAGQAQGARLLGSFLEGPHFTAPFRGSHPEAFLSAPEGAALEALWLASEGTLLRVALAPESTAAMQAIAWWRARGVKVGVAHTAASFAQVNEAHALGADCGVHLYNGMSGLHHREPGCCGAVLYLDMLAELIADGIHVNPVMLNLAYRMKGYRHIALITDCMRAGGLGEGRYRLGAQEITVRHGEARTDDGSLAGSTCSLDQAVRNMVTLAGVPVWEAVQMASAVPAAYLGLQDRLGAIRPGAAASFTAVDPAMTVAETYINGECAYRRPA
ncbi:MAG: N-acetylglucosamine-6-phosphate deacetylase [Edwardsiella piscicida]